MPVSHRAYLIDSSIYIFRGWNVLPESLVDQENQPVNAVHGFADFLIQLLENTQAQYIICAMDAKQTDSYRREIYPDYKANRPPKPESLRRQFKLCRMLLHYAGISTIASPRYEADDLIGSIACQLQHQAHPFTIVTADKDLAQLVGPNDKWWNIHQRSILDYHAISKHFGILPEQIADMLAISGDKVDNIPGVPGIGYKTAAKILKKFGTLENLLDNIHTVGSMKFRNAKRTQENLAAHINTMKLAKQLTKIVTSVPLPTDLSLQRQTANLKQLETFFAYINLSPLQRLRWRRFLEH